MWLVSVLALVPVLLLAAGRGVPASAEEQLARVDFGFEATDERVVALSFLAGMAVAGSPFHGLVRYLATVVHELGHAFTAGILGGRPKNIKVALNAAGLATYQPPPTWGRARASIVSFAGYPAPAVASLAAVGALTQGYSKAWFAFCGGTLALAVVALMRNFWGFVWTAAFTALAYLGVRTLDAEQISMAVGGLAGYLAFEGYRNSWEQMSIVRLAQGSGCDAEMIGYFTGMSPRLVGLLHLVTAAGLGGYAGYLAVSPYWDQIVEWVRQAVEGL